MFRIVLLLTIVAFAYGWSNIPPMGGRIVGGERTSIEKHPYQISVEFFGRHDCGGTLIRSNAVLTGAHCIQCTPPFYSVRAGTSKLDQGGKRVSVSKICIHPKFKNWLYDYDVAVLLLRQPLKLSHRIQTIYPQTAGKEVPVGTMATATGWGVLSSGGNSSRYLQKVQLPRVSQKSCAAAYPNDTITSRMRCYGFEKGGKDVCQGDSGGPLVVNGKVVGIVSWGDKCAKPKIPGVYTNIANKEINDHIKNCLKSFQ